MQTKHTILAVVGAVLFFGSIWFLLPEATVNDTAIELAFVPGVVAEEPGAVEAPAPPAPLTSPANRPTIPKGYKRYENNQYHFALAIPTTLNVQEYSEGGGAVTITFEGAEGEASFQIFIVPYTSQTITAERFKLDVPSGVLKEPKTVMIDATQATLFESSNIIMGDTREVWFIKNGFLYEVTTYKELDAWLSQIMKTWAFI